MRATRPAAAIEPTRGVERAFWWAYEHAPEGMDALFHLGRRYVLPMLRHRLPVRRLTGATTSGHPSVSMITTGAAMTLDVLVNRFFCEPPRVEFLEPVPLARLPAVLEQLAPTTDLMLACVPRAFVGWFGPSYLRIPALVGARLPLGDTLATTLAHATRDRTLDVRRVLAADYHWTFSRELRTSSVSMTSSTSRLWRPASGRWPCSGSGRCFAVSSGRRVA